MAKFNINNMNKTSGKKGAFAPIKQDASRIVISYGFKAVEGTDMAEWREVVIYKKQASALTLADVKEAIIGDINQRVKEAIVSGFTYDGNPVWLSEENQLNFSQAAIPATLKIGEQQDGTPIYKTFSVAAELKAFNDACSLWRQQCLTAGYAEKDAIDWAPYEALFQTKE